MSTRNHLAPWKSNFIERSGAAVFLALLVLVTQPLCSALAQTAHNDRPGYEYDPYNGEEIMELCAGCHGEFGQGGADGEYPRLAGLPEDYLISQMRAFISRERESIPMIPYANERDTPEQDLLDISIFLSRLKLMKRMPKIPEDMDSYEKLLIASQVFNVPRLEGDHVGGEKLYKHQCQKCHGEAGVGRGSTPLLAGQYTVYLRQQIEFFRGGVRENQKMDKYLLPLSNEDVEKLLAYLSIADD